MIITKDQGLLFAPEYDPSPELAPPDLSDLSQFTRCQDPSFARATLDAHRIRFIHLYDKLSSLSNSRTRLLPHQIEATHRVANALRPRFILADEVGLGKTVEAGLIMKELSFRRGFKRYLVITPASLTAQWRQEMRSKFNDDFEILDRKSFPRVRENWNAYSKLITSLDFIKNSPYAEEVLKRKWDVVIFDEAHRLRRDYSKVTRAYAFAAEMSTRCESLLLLTATPFRGKLEELYYLVRLCDPALLGPVSSFLNEYVYSERSDSSMGNLKEKISRIMLRRRKIEVGGFVKRFACTVQFDLSERERALYDETTDYVKREYNLAMQGKNRAIGFIMIVFQKLLDSSTRALLQALERRRNKLEHMLLGTTRLPSSNQTETEITWEDDDWFDEEDAAETAAEIDDDRKRTIRDIRREILTISRLISIGRSVTEDRKFLKMRETLELLKRKGHTKFIIFTQFRTTQDYLAENLSDFRVETFHGSLNLQQKEDVICRFRDNAEILICTEAGGEGRNLQFASVLFNYDLPWSPLRIEQRIGRIHRFGQKNDVRVFNFSTRDTVAERILSILIEKIHLFEQSIGPSDTLLGVVEDEVGFQKSVMSFVTGRKSAKELGEELENKNKIAESAYKKLNDLVTPQCLDFDLSGYYEHMRLSRDIESREIERLTLSYLNYAENPAYKIKAVPQSKIQPLLPEYSIQNLPFAINQEHLEAKTAIESPATFQAEVALSNENADFLAVGHPLVDQSLDYFTKHCERKLIYHLSENTEFQSGYYFVCLCHFKNDLSRSELLYCKVPNGDSAVATILEEFIPFSDAKNIEQHREITPTRCANAMISEQTENREYGELGDAAKKATLEFRAEAAARTIELRDQLHSIFKKEEYKLEIDFGKKMRNLEEKLDRSRMRFTQKPDIKHRTVVRRYETELKRLASKRTMELEKVRSSAKIETTLEILQVYIVP